MSSSESSSPPRTRIVVAGLTDVGRQRKHNEDCVLIRPEHSLFVVADGMGGHNAGDVASKLVAKSLGEYFDATAVPGAPGFQLPAEYAGLPPGGKRLAAGVRKANYDVFTVSNTVQAHHGMGSTVVGIHLTEDAVHIAHVGDSRCYRIRDGAIQQMTRDHSLINDALDLKPDLTKEELARLPKNIITRALGMKEAVKVDIKSEPALPGDTFLLCSDGLTGMVAPDQILEVVNIATEPREACEILIAEANDAGGTDNISAVVVRIEEVLSDPVAIADHEIEVAQEERSTDEANDQEFPTKVMASPPPPSAETPVPSSNSPSLEIAAEGSDESIDELDRLEAAARLAELDNVKLDWVGAWDAKIKIPRCRRCSFELFPGNRFCVECGLRISA